MKLIIGITGATGVVYATRLLEVLESLDDIETHLIISQAAKMIIGLETGKNIEDIRKLADFSYGIEDISACISSGSFPRDGMIIVPCTIKTMSGIASSYTENLITRAADVTLKERKKLVLMVRETPLHLGHLRKMERLTEMGAVVMPPIPAFYFKPKTIQEIIDQTVARLLDIFDIKHNLSQRWSGPVN